MINKNIKIQVSGIRYSENSIGALVDLILNDEDICTSASRLVWFPKSISKLEIIETENSFPIYYITAPKWFLEKNKI